MAFFDEIVQLTKDAHSVNVQLEKDADVLTKHLERKVKSVIKNKASLGRTSTLVDLNTFHVDFASKFSVPQLLFDNITETYVPVAHRVFLAKDGPLAGFVITEKAKNTFEIDWSHGIVKKEPQPPINKGQFAEPPLHLPQINTQPFASNVYYGQIQPPSEQEVQDFIDSMFPYLNVV